MSKATEGYCGTCENVAGECCCADMGWDAEYIPPTSSPGTAVRIDRSLTHREKFLLTLVADFVDPDCDFGRLDTSARDRIAAADLIRTLCAEPPENAPEGSSSGERGSSAANGRSGDVRAGEAT